MRMYKIRQLNPYSKNHPRSAEKVMGVTIPNEVAIFFPECRFSIERLNIGSKIGIFLESGTVQIITKEEISNYSFEDCRV